MYLLNIPNLCVLKLISCSSKLFFKLKRFLLLLKQKAVIKIYYDSRFFFNPEIDLVQHGCKFLIQLISRYRCWKTQLVLNIFLTFLKLFLTFIILSQVGITTQSSYSYKLITVRKSNKTRKQNKKVYL